MQKQKPTILVDAFEKDKLLYERLLVYGEEKGVEIKKKEKAGPGDYIIIDADGNRWGIEYKSFMDCYNSIIKKERDGAGRIYGQLAELVYEFDGRAIFMLGAFDPDKDNTKRYSWIVKRVVYSFFSRRSLLITTWILSGPDHIAKFMVDTALEIHKAEFRGRQIRIVLDMPPSKKKIDRKV